MYLLINILLLYPFTIDILFNPYYYLPMILYISYQDIGNIYFILSLVTSYLWLT